MQLDELDELMTSEADRESEIYTLKVAAMHMYSGECIDELFWSHSRLILPHHGLAGGETVRSLTSRLRFWLIT